MTESRYMLVDAGKNADAFLAGRGSAKDRYSSWDHCFNYFSNRHIQGRVSEMASGENLQLACLHLGFYLASWGMYRGSAALLQRSSMALEPVVQEVVSAPETLWSLDVDSYHPESIAELLEFSKKIRGALPRSKSERVPTDTLVTKTLLGVFGNVPAFDRYFRKGFGSHSYGAKSLMKIRSYFDQHRDQIRLRQVPTVDFAGQETSNRYTAAKVIDMIFFVEGGGRG